MVSAAIIGLLILAAVAAWRLARRRPTPAAPAHKTNPAAGFRSVEIQVRSGACEAAHALSGQRFLAHQAPALPLPTCAAARCSCRFAKLSDRRTDDRRLPAGNLTSSMFLTNNRRERSERRDED